MEEHNCNNRPHNRFEHVTFETIIYVLETGSVRVVLETRVSKTFAADCTAYTEILPRPSPSVLSLSRVSTTETNEISLGRLSFRPTHTGAFRRGKRRTPSRPPFFFFGDRFNTAESFLLFALLPMEKQEEGEGIE